MENRRRERACLAFGCSSDVTIFNIVLQPCVVGNYLKIPISAVSFMLKSVDFFSVHHILFSAPLGAFNPYALMNNSPQSFFRSPCYVWNKPGKGKNLPQPHKYLLQTQCTLAHHCTGFMLLQWDFGLSGDFVLKVIWINFLNLSAQPFIKSLLKTRYANEKTH